MNESIFFFLHSFANRSAAGDGVIFFFAEIFPLIVIISAGLFVLFHHEVLQAANPYQVFLQKRREVVSVFLASSISWILAQSFKLLFAFARPSMLSSEVNSLFATVTFSFPSGHAAFFSALAVSLFFYHQRIGYLFGSFALLISLSRIMAGVHFPSDILAGFLLGVVVAYLNKNL